MDLGSILALAFILAIFVGGTIVCGVLYILFEQGFFKNRKPVPEDEHEQLRDIYDVALDESKQRAKEFKEGDFVSNEK